MIHHFIRFKSPMFPVLFYCNDSLGYWPNWLGSSGHWLAQGPADTDTADSMTGSNTDSTDTELVHPDSADIGPADLGPADIMTGQDTGPADT